MTVGVTLPEAVRYILIGLSWFSIGVSCYSIARATNMLFVRKRERPYGQRRYALAVLMSRLGYSFVVGLITLRVLQPAPNIPVTIESILYGIGLLLSGLGFIGTARWGNWENQIRDNANH